MTKRRNSTTINRRDDHDDDRERRSRKGHQKITITSKVPSASSLLQQQTIFGSSFPLHQYHHFLVGSQSIHGQSHDLSTSRLSPQKSDPSPSPLTLTCPICLKPCKHERNFNRHMLIHKGIKDFECSICGQRFRQGSHLKSHILSKHEDRKAHTCLICDKSFARIDNLRRHSLIHAGLRPYYCPKCGKSYSQSQHLKSHRAKCSDN